MTTTTTRANACQWHTGLNPVHDTCPAACGWPWSGDAITYTNPQGQTVTAVPGQPGTVTTGRPQRVEIAPRIPGRSLGRPMNVIIYDPPECVDELNTALYEGDIPADVALEARRGSVRRRNCAGSRTPCRPASRHQSSWGPPASRTSS